MEGWDATQWNEMEWNGCRGVGSAGIGLVGSSVLVCTVRSGGAVAYLLEVQRVGGAPRDHSATLNPQLLTLNPQLTCSRYSQWLARLKTTAQQSGALSATTRQPSTGKQPLVPPACSWGDTLDLTEDWNA